MTGSARKMDFNPQLSLKTSGSKPEFTKTITEKLEADEALFDALRRNVRPPVALVELDLHINDPEFSEAMATRLLEMLTA